jgi:hypothetical protein
MPVYIVLVTNDGGLGLLQSQFCFTWISKDRKLIGIRELKEGVSLQGTDTSTTQQGFLFQYFSGVVYMFIQPNPRLL